MRCVINYKYQNANEKMKLQIREVKLQIWSFTPQNSKFEVLKFIFGEQKILYLEL